MLSIENIISWKKPQISSIEIENRFPFILNHLYQSYPTLVPTCISQSLRLKVSLFIPFFTFFPNFPIRAILA